MSHHDEDEYTVDAATLTPTELATWLTAQAHGDYGTEAAALLILGHEHWLRRSDFRAYIDAFSDGWNGTTTTTPMARIRWRDVIAAVNGRALRGSTSELSILLIAASLVGHCEINLRDCIYGLDATNSRLVLTAIAHYATNGGTR